MEKLLKVRINIDECKRNMMKRVKKCLCNERGEGPISGIIFWAIVIIALIGASGVLDDFFKDSITMFKNWASKKLQDLFV